MSNSSKSPHIRGRWLVVAAAVLWSTSGLFTKAPIVDQWPMEGRGLILAFWRALFAGLALLPLVGRPQWTWRLVPVVISFAVMSASFLLAMTHTTAANTIWLQSTAPVWVFLVGTLWLGESAVRRDYWMVALGMTGVGVILFFEWTQGSPRTDQLGTIYGLISGVTFAGVMLGLRQLRQLSGFWIIAVCQLSAAILLAPWAIREMPSCPNTNTLAWMALFGTLQMAVPYVLFARGVRYLAGHEASCITLLEPLLVPLWVFLAWHNAPDYVPPSWWTWVGATFILAGLVIRFWPDSGDAESKRKG